MKQKVVVIGHGYTSRLGVIRALGKSGYEVIVVVMTSYKHDGKTLNTKKPIDCYSKYVNQVYYCFSNKEQLVKLLIEKCSDSRQKVVLIPDSDFSAATVDLYQDQLKEFFLFPHINHEKGAIVSWMNKLHQKEVAYSLGIHVAKAWTMEVDNGSYEIPKGISYPCFPKPMATIMGGKSGLKKCQNEMDLRMVINSLISRNKTISVLVEEFKDIETEYALLGLSDGNNVYIPGIIETTSLANGGHFGVAKQGIIKPIDGFEETIEMYKKFVLSTGFVGIFDIDFFRSDGEMYFCEMNFRYGGSGYAYTAMGVNLPEMLVKSLLEYSFDDMPKLIRGSASFVNERMCLDDWYRGFCTTKEYCRIIKDSDISFVDDKEDSKPQKVFVKLFCQLFLKRCIKKCIGKKL